MELSLGLSLPSIAMRGAGGGGAPGSVLDLDFKRNRYFGASFANMANARASDGWAQNAAGVWTKFGPNVLRRTDKGVLSEEAVTNQVRNSKGAGATPGVIGSGGAAPTNWGLPTSAGVTFTVVGSGVEDGLSYLDFDMAGTAAGGGARGVFDGNSIIAATNGQVWTASVFMKLISGTFPGSFQLELRQYNAGVALSIVTSPAYVPNSVDGLGKKRFVFTGTTNEATITHIAPTWRIAMPTGAVNCRIRVAQPDYVMGSRLYSPVETSGAAAARSADVITLPLFGGPELNDPNTSGWVVGMLGTGTPGSPPIVNPDGSLEVSGDGAGNGGQLIKEFPTEIGKRYSLKLTTIGGTSQYKLGTTSNGSEIFSTTNLAGGSVGVRTFVATSTSAFFTYQRSAGGSSTMAAPSLREVDADIQAPVTAVVIWNDPYGYGAINCDFFALTDGTTNSRLEAGWNGDASGVAQRQSVNGAVVGGASAGSSFGRRCAAMAWAANDQAISVDGGAVQTGAAASMPLGLTTLGIASLHGGFAQSNNYIERIILFPGRLSNAELVAKSQLAAWGG